MFEHFHVERTGDGSHVDDLGGQSLARIAVVVPCEGRRGRSPGSVVEIHERVCSHQTARRYRVRHSCDGVESGPVDVARNVERVRLNRPIGRKEGRLRVGVVRFVYVLSGVCHTRHHDESDESDENRGAW